MVKTNEELSLIIKAQSGCRSALNQLASDVYKRVYPMLYRMTQDYALANDLIQETLLTMLEHIKKLKQIDGFWGWIHTVAKNKVYDYYRKRHFSEIINSEDSITMADFHSPFETVLENEILEQLSDAIDNLRKQDRDVVQLRHFERRPYTEIASLCRTTPQQARIRFFRAKQSLRKELYATGFDFDRITGFTKLYKKIKNTY